MSLKRFMTLLSMVVALSLILNLVACTATGEFYSPDTGLGSDNDTPVYVNYVNTIPVSLNQTDLTGWPGVLADDQHPVTAEVISDIQTATELTFSSFNTLFLNDTANSKSTAGITINQGGYDNEILSFKSSDVAHGLTSITETDTFFFFTKQEANRGGMLFRGIKDPGNNNSAFAFYGHLGSDLDTTKSTAGRGLAEICASQHSGGAITAVVADGNILVVSAYDGSSYKARLIVDNEGDLWLSGGVTADLGYTEYDEHDDAILLKNSLSLNDYELLVNAGIAERKYTGDNETVSSYSFNLTEMIKLVAGGVYQNRDKIDRLEARITELERLTK